MVVSTVMDGRYYLPLERTAQLRAGNSSPTAAVTVAAGIFFLSYSFWPVLTPVDPCLIHGKAHCVM